MARLRLNYATHVVEVRVRDRNAVDAVSEVKQAVIVILIMVEVAGEIDMVDPNVVGCLDGKGITNVRDDLRDLDVTDDDVGLFKDTETDAVES